MDRIKELSNFHPDDSKVEESEEESDEEEVPYSKPPPARKVSSSGKYFKSLIRLSLDELKKLETARSAFASTMAYPINQIEERFSKVTLDGKPVKVIPWTDDDEVNEIIAVLKSIDPGFDINICSWGQFKAVMPILYKFFMTHVCYHDYLTEISLCDRDHCGVCRKFGSGLRTPDSPIGRYTLLRPMDRPVMDPMNQGHFVPASLTASFISEKNLSFEKLKAVLPDTGKQTFLTEAQLADRKADKDAGGSDLFKGQNVRDIVECTKCSFPRIIVSKHTLHNRKPTLSRKEKKALLDELEDFKESYICGDPCPVDGFETKRDLRCGDFVQTQYFTFAKGKGNKDWSSNLCCFCCNSEDLLTIDEMKDEYPRLGGKQPLRLCKYCVSLKIEPPTTNASAKYSEKSAQEKTAKKRRRDHVSKMGLKKTK